jgi:transcriptional regulator NrdR family protein
MMICPACHAPRTGVLKSSRAADGTVVRRRFCGRCEHRWTTYEYHASRAESMRRAERIVASIADELAKNPPEKAWEPDFSDLK